MHTSRRSTPGSRGLRRVATPLVLLLVFAAGVFVDAVYGVGVTRAAPVAPLGVPPTNVRYDVSGDLRAMDACRARGRLVVAVLPDNTLLQTPPLLCVKDIRLTD